MTDPKYFFVLWSRAAADAAAPNLSPLQTKLLEEVTEIVAQARDYFSHVFANNEDLCYLCTGHELSDRWEIYVQIGRYKPMPPLRDDHPDPDWRGKVFKFPEAIKEPENEVFAPFEDLV